MPADGQHIGTDAVVGCRRCGPRPDAAGGEGSGEKRGQARLRVTRRGPRGRAVDPMALNEAAGSRADARPPPRAPLAHPSRTARTPQERTSRRSRAVRAPLGTPNTMRRIGTTTKAERKQACAHYARTRPCKHLTPSARELQRGRVSCQGGGSERSSAARAGTFRGGFLGSLASCASAASSKAPATATGLPPPTPAAMACCAAARRFIGSHVHGKASRGTRRAHEWETTMDVAVGPTFGWRPRESSRFVRIATLAPLPMVPQNHRRRPAATIFASVSASMSLPMTELRTRCRAAASGIAAGTGQPNWAAPRARAASSRLTPSMTRPPRARAEGLKRLGKRIHRGRAVVAVAMAGQIPPWLCCMRVMLPRSGAHKGPCHARRGGPSRGPARRVSRY